MSFSGPGVLPPMKIWDGMKSLPESKSIPTDRKGSGLGVSWTDARKVGPLQNYVLVSNYFLFFSPIFGEDSHFDDYFSDGLKPSTSYLIMQMLVTMKPWV